MKWSDARVDAFRARLDGLSADIKALEEYLSGAVAFVEVRIPVDHESMLGWGKAEPDRWRIIYFTDDDQGVARGCPLLETKVDVRLKCAPLLPILLKTIGDSIARLGEAP